MNLETYTPLALRTASSLGNVVNDVMHAAAGMSGEAGEVLDLAKKSFAYGAPINRAKMLEEIGDQIWYINLMIATLDSTWDEVLAANIRKLEARYPSGHFNADKAINRDTDNEKRAINL